jgi:hypothetical protein
VLASDEAKPATASSEPASNVEQLGGPLDNLDSKTTEELQARSLRDRFALGYCLAVSLAPLIYGMGPR